MMLKAIVDKHGVSSGADQDSMLGKNEGPSAVSVNRMLANQRYNPWVSLCFVLIVYAPKDLSVWLVSDNFRDHIPLIH